MFLKIQKKIRFITRPEEGNKKKDCTTCLGFFNFKTCVPIQKEKTNNLFFVIRLKLEIIRAGLQEVTWFFVDKQKTKYTVMNSMIF